MYRRIGCIMMVLFLLVSLPVMAEEETKRLLWEIPFGISPEACVQLLLEKTGVVIKEAPSAGSYEIYESTPEQDISLYGYPVTLRADFTEGKLRFLGLGISADEMGQHESEEALSEAEKTEMLGKGLAVYQELLSRVAEQYGAPTGGYLDVWNNGGEGEKPAKPPRHSYPVENGVLNAEAALDALHSYENGMISTFYGNVGVGFYYTSQADGGVSHSTTAIDIVYMALKDDDDISFVTSFEHEEGEAILREIELTLWP